MILIRKRHLLSCFVCLILTSGGAAAKLDTPAAPPLLPSIIDSAPGLKDRLFREPDTRIRLGFGVSPLRIMRNRAGLSLSIFQMHWNVSDRFDFELLNFYFASSVSGDGDYKFRSYTVRTFPKYVFGKNISAGLLLGYEFVVFPEINARIYKNNYFSPIEEFSSRGFILGVGLSQTFQVSDRFTLKVNELAYRQGYNTIGTSDGWQYYYENDALNSDTTPIDAGYVIAIEFSIVY